MRMPSAPAQPKKWTADREFAGDWVQGQWAVASGDILVRDILVCARDSRVQVVSPGIAEDGTVHVAVDDVRTGCRREVLVMSHLLQAVTHESQERLSARPWKPQLLGKSWQQRLQRDDHCCGSSPHQEAFTDGLGHVVCATACCAGKRAERAAKKAWRMDKRAREVVVRDAADDVHVFSPGDFMRAGQSVRCDKTGDVRKFRGGKCFKRQRRDEAWSKRAAGP
eukprot:TRINITY_DN1057_c0_g1_i1.p1 TRINITY_DN1057_c0_g1~~TRINITY_DN1057_c0_g1_i1.p1  ORF type:complete len:223 (+),score=22.22 TRINITY_DN1057_c0_g1_i1:73-741(+)